jgi:ABC-type multidrug transport system fused ATPase/permease subunit
MLHSHVAKGGANLSSGERQLLCFARALLSDARVLILDEATSNLDERSDAAVQAVLRDEFEQQARGVEGGGVAHRVEGTGGLLT